MLSAAHIFFVRLFFFFHTLSFSHAHSLSFFARFCAYSCGCIQLFICCPFSCFRARSHTSACISLLPHVSLIFLSSLYIVLLEPVIPSVLYFGTGQFFAEPVQFFYVIGVLLFRLLFLVFFLFRFARARVCVCGCIFCVLSRAHAGALMAAFILLFFNNFSEAAITSECYANAVQNVVFFSADFAAFY